MELTTREQLLGLTSRRYKTVPIAGLKFRIRNLSEAEKSDFEASVLNSEAKYSLSKIRQQRRRLICLCLVNDHNEPLLKPEDSEQLKAIDGLVTSKLYDECREHCGFEENDLEELVKNSDAIHAADSLDD
jgi:hypothetical protein